MSDREARLEWTQVRDSYYLVVDGERIAEIAGEMDLRRVGNVNAILALVREAIG